MSVQITHKGKNAIIIGSYSYNGNLGSFFLVDSPSEEDDVVLSRIKSSITICDAVDVELTLTASSQQQKMSRFLLRLEFSSDQGKNQVLGKLRFPLGEPTRTKMVYCPVAAPVTQNDEE